MIAAAVAAVAPVVIGVVTLVNRRRRKRRTGDLRLFAGRLGLTFEVAPSGWVFEREVTPFIFDQGNRLVARNAMKGLVRGIDLAVFDLGIVTGKKGRRIRWQTVVEIRSESLDLPSFVVRPEKLRHKLGSVFGYQDIDFADHPSFSKRYLLRGADDAALRVAFARSVLDFLAERKGVSVEGSGQTFIFYSTKRLVDPAELAGRIEETIELASLLAR